MVYNVENLVESFFFYDSKIVKEFYHQKSLNNLKYLLSFMNH